MQRHALRLVALVLALGAGRAFAQTPDWTALADEGVIEILTRDADGEARETSVWLVVLDGQGYVRTGDTRWRANIARDPNVGVRIAGAEYALRAVQVRDAAQTARVNAAMRAKYGFSDRVVGWFTSEAAAVFFAFQPRAGP